MFVISVLKYVIIKKLKNWKKQSSTYEDDEKKLIMILVFKNKIISYNQYNNDGHTSCLVRRKYNHISLNYYFRNLFNIMIYQGAFVLQQLLLILSKG